MKTGDKVWLFNNIIQEIEERIVDGVTCDRGTNYIWRLELRGEKGAFYLGFECFPTREALCEHYRKIFE